ncbi:MAG TPA: SDR family NAD(P)-dependent oxidoreductase [Gemmatales bacterium]|nr:SDR family NAD(P)-dependent oxidoreductase [Gemmatales bacterium]
MQRTILMTGVTRGLGRALVDRFIEKNCILWGCGRSVEHIQTLSKQYPSPHAFAVVDVASDKDVERWVTPLIQQYGVPDLLINNAALMNRLAPLWEIAANEFDPLIDVNIKGVANLIRHVVPAMIERSSGIIINMSSGWGRSTSSEVAPYCASKYAIEGLTKALADDLPDGLAAIPLNPGIIDTDMLRTCFQESAGHYPDAKHWSYQAADYILALGATDNGLSRTIPQ